MNLRRVNVEFLLYGLAFLIALSLRFYNLGAAPLTDQEARWALKAYRIANPISSLGEIVIGPQPVYIFLTATIFKLFGSSNFLARFWPAFAGTALVLAPTFFRVKFPRIALLILVFALSIDPGLVTVSRQAAGPMLALSFFFFGISTWVINNRIASGILLGMATLSGPAFYPGAIGMLLAVITFRRFTKQEYRSNLSIENGKSERSEIIQTDEISLHKLENYFLLNRDFIIAASLTVLIFGTFFFQYPQGIISWFNTILIYLQSWFIPSGVALITVVIAILVFQPFALLFCFTGIFHYFTVPIHDHQNQARFLFVSILWLGFTTFLIFLNPSRQMADLSWILVLLWFVAAWELRRYVPENRIEPISLLLVIFVLLLAGLFWYALIMPDQMLVISGLPDIGLRIFMMIGILVIAALALLLVSYGWSKSAVRFGVVWGTGIALIIYSMSLIWGANQIRPNEPQELWSPAPGIQQTALLMQSIDSFSNILVGSSKQINILSTVTNPALVWFLKDYPNSKFSKDINQQELPPLIITSADETFPELQSAYRGQDFVSSIKPAWTGSLPDAFLRWLTFREAPVLKDRIILWARTDLFPDSASEIQPPVIEVIE